MRKVTIDPDKIPQDMDFKKYYRKEMFNFLGAGAGGGATTAGGLMAADIALTGGAATIILITYSSLIGAGAYIAGSKINAGFDERIYGKKIYTSSASVFLKAHRKLRKKIIKHCADDEMPRQEWERGLYELLGQATALGKVLRVKKEDKDELIEGGLLFLTEEIKKGQPIDMSRVINVRGEPQAPGNPYITIADKPKPMAAYKPLGY